MKYYCYFVLLVSLVTSLSSARARGDQPLLFEHNSDVVFSRLLPNGRTLAVSTWDGDVFLWDLQTQKKRRLIKGRAVMEDNSVRTTTVEFSSDSQKLATIDHVRGVVRVWKIGDQSQARLWKTFRVAPLMEEGMIFVEFTSNGRELVVAAGFMVLPRLKNDGSGMFEEEGKEPYGRAFLIRKYDIATGVDGPISRKFSWTLVADIAVSRCGKRLFVSEAGMMPDSGEEFFHTRVIDLASRKEIYRVDESMGPIMVSPNGKFAACTHAGLFPLGTSLVTRVVDLKTGRKIHAFKESDGLIWAPSFSPDSNLLAFPAKGKTVRVWDMKEEKFMVARQEPWQARYVQFLPDGKLLAIAVAGKTVRNRATFDYRFLNDLRG